jgi:hypothetical protein
MIATVRKRRNRTGHRFDAREVPVGRGVELDETPVSVHSNVDRRRRTLECEHRIKLRSLVEVVEFAAFQRTTEVLGGILAQGIFAIPDREAPVIKVHVLQWWQSKAQLVVRDAGECQVGMPPEGDRDMVGAVGFDHRRCAKGSWCDLESHLESVGMRKQRHEVVMPGPVKDGRGSLLLDTNVRPVLESQEETVAGQAVVPLHFRMVRPGIGTESVRIGIQQRNATGLRLGTKFSLRYREMQVLGIPDAP